MLKLERIFYPEIHSSVNIQEEGSMEIENRFSLNVNFDNKNQKCISTFEIQSVCKSHEDWFNVRVKIVGIFSCEKVDSDEDRKQIHTESYDTLFPYAQSVISELTTKAGMIPLILEKAPINFGEVKITND